MLRIARPLVSTAWLSKVVAASPIPPSLRILDVTWSPGKRSGPQIYQEGHIPGSHFFDLSECRDKESPYRVMLPSPEHFANYVGQHLGISSDTDVIVYDNDPVLKVKTAGRVWWMFRVFGHERVSVLDGGMDQWMIEGHPVTTDVPETPKAATFNAHFRHELLTNFEDILDHQKEAKFQLLDSRPPHWYDGTTKGQLPGLDTGTIKTASLLPYPSLFEEGSTVFKSPQEIRAIFASKGIDLSQPVTTYCNAGVTANMLTLAAFAAGKEDVATYDGSWDEFVQRAPREAMNINVYKKEE